jgi:hypothetical protein
VGDITQFTADGKTHPSDWVAENEFDEDFTDEFHNVIDITNNDDANDAFTPDVLNDTYLNIELSLPRGGGEVEFARVTKRLRDKDGLPIGTANDNPILDTQLYEVEFPDGHKAALVANVIAEKLFAHVDEGGNRLALLDDIVDYHANGQQITMDDAIFITTTGTTRKKTTTAGWELLLQWKDNSTTWVSLKDAKEHYPVQIAEYAVAVGIANKPAFAVGPKYH